MPNYRYRGRERHNVTIHKPNILAIDDIPANLLTLGSALAPHFDLQIATSGLMALALAAESLPDLILLDVMMPEMDGYETCRRFKADSRLRDIPVIFVTGLSDIDAEIKGLALGAVDYLTKPINVEIALQRIHNHLERERLRKEVEAHYAKLAVQFTQLESARLALQTSEQRLNLALDSAKMGAWDLDIINDKAVCSHRHDQIFGYASQQSDWSVRSFMSHVLPEDRDLVQKNLDDAFATGHFSMECRIRWTDQTVHWIAAQGHAYQNEAGIPVRMMGVIMDITERKQAEEKLSLAASVFSHAREAIVITAPDGTIIEVNDAFTHITGYHRNEVVGRNPRILSSGRQTKEFYAAMWGSLLELGYWDGEIWNRRKSGEIYAEMQTISAVRDAQGIIRQFVSLSSDITAIKAHESQLEHLAHYDVLTGLPNRVLLADRLHQAIGQIARRGKLLAVVFLDLDGFKAVNDQHGHESGDQLLIALTARMTQALREGDTLARLGGDEFVAVLIDLVDAEAVVPILTRLVDATSEPEHVGDLVLQVSASLGVTFYPQVQDINADQLLRQADQAMYQAKLAGKNRYHIFDV